MHTYILQVVETGAGAITTNARRLKRMDAMMTERETDASNFSKTSILSTRNSRGSQGVSINFYVDPEMEVSV